MTTTLELRRSAGPPNALVPDELSLIENTLIGRAVDTDLCLPESSVSRKHASLLARSDGWFLIDQNSTTGTRLNRVTIAPDLPVRIAPGDQISIGPWTFTIQGDPSRSHTIDLQTDADTASTKPQTSSRRLDALSQCLAALEDAADTIDLARAAARAAMTGTGYRRAAVLIPPATNNDAPALLAGLEVNPDGEESELDTTQFTPSRSLIDAARKGTVATHASDPAAQPINIAQSIAELNIHSAVCAPVVVDRDVAALIYLDARQGESHVHDAVAFCEDVARMYSFALSREAQADLRRRQDALRIEFDYARELRAMLAPPPVSQSGQYEVAFRTTPGLFVSADLFDIAAQPDGSRILLFGDASGHGVGAAMLAALTHAHLIAAFQSQASLAEALTLANRFLTDRPSGGRFISLLVARCMPDGSVRMIDAGHGHWMRAHNDNPPIHAGRSTAPPLGIDPDAVFETSESRLRDGERLICFTDGITDQIDAHGQPFGLDRLDRVIDQSTSPEQDVNNAFTAVETHAAGRFDDDCTIASIQYNRH